MATTIDDTSLPTVMVGGREFPIGPVTIHQLFLVKNLAVNIGIATRGRQAKRRAELTTHAATLAKSEEGNIRHELAATLAQAEEKVQEELLARAMQLFIENQVNHAENELGFGGTYGPVMDILQAMSEDQLITLAVILLDRHTHSHVTKEFVEQHFALEWFTEALEQVLMQNNVVKIVKNFQRLGMLTNFQLDSSPADSAAT